MSTRDYVITHRCCWPLRPGHTCQCPVRKPGDRCHFHAVPAALALAAASTTTNPVEHPSHYNAGSIEVIAVIEDWNLNFNEGNIVKYVARARRKGKHLEDLQKARQYIDFEIARVQRGGEGA